MKGIFMLAFSYLKKQKGRSVSIIVAIGLATLISFSNIVQNQTNVKLGTEKLHNTFGTYDYEFNNIKDDKLQEIINDNKDGRVFKINNLGNIVYKNGVKSILNTYNPNYLEESKYSFLEGRAPENENEIVLEQKAIKEMGLENKLGSYIDFNINNKYKNDKNKQESFNKEHKFKLVGIVSRPNDYYEKFGEYKLRAFTGSSEGLVPDDITTKDGILNIENETATLEKMYEKCNKYGLKDYEFSMSIGLVQGLSSLGVGEKITIYEIKNMLFPIAVSALLICNIFIMTLFDMRKSIGMLRAIGARKYQICSMIFIQSLILVVIGVASGFLIGGAYVYNYIARIYPQNPSLYISKEAILTPILVAVITVFISNVVTLYKATKISPIEGMRNNGLVNRKFKNRFYYKWIRNMFNITGEMAYKNVFRFRTRSILCILSIGLVGSMYITSLSMYNKGCGVMHMPSNNIGEYDIKISKNDYNVEIPIGMYTNDEIKNIKSIDGVDVVDGNLELDGLTDNNDEYVSVKGYTKEDLKKLDKYIKEKAEDKNGEYVNVFVNNHQDGSDEPLNKDFKIGEIIEIKIPIVNDGEIDYKVEKFRIAGFLDREWLLNNYYGKAISVIMPIEKLSELTNIKGVNKLGIKTESGRQKEVEDKLEKSITDKGYNKLESVAKYNAEQAKQQEIQKMQSMFLLLLMSVVASLNIYYTIKTSILVRTREISTLRSIGMSMKKVKSMLIKEALIYSFFSCILGSIHATYKEYEDVTIVNEIMKNGFGVKNLEKFEVPLNEIVIFILFVIVICIISVYLSKRKLEKMSISEGNNINE